MAEKRRILVFGAHPDDCDITAGGSAALWAQAGHHVRFISLTNGDAGHQSEGGASLARRRRAEAQAAARVLGVEYVILDNHDGELLPTLENRREVIRLIREHQPHLVLGPRPNDYHPDHRYAALLIQDAAYMVTVPNIAAFAEHLPHDPVLMYVSDRFRKPTPFAPDVVVDIDAAAELKVGAMACHVSQFFEWLPYNAGTQHEVPDDEAARRAWLHVRWHPFLGGIAERFRSELIARYGAEHGSQVQYAEAFEWCEYGAPLTPETIKQLFPF
ncbi:MAG: PIG-L family deacetylase [Armatimonadota bacterium]|nr:PIG-L family deacetylase [Armatimonadota bacterium]